MLFALAPLSRRFRQCRPGVVDCCIVIVIVADPLRWSFADCRIIDAAAVAAIVDWIGSILLKFAVVYPYE